MGHLLAALAHSPSIPFHYSLSILQSIPNPSLFAVNNLIRCFAKSESPRQSLALYGFIRMSDLQPNNYTFPFLSQACSKVLGLVEGTQVHSHVVKLGFDRDVYVRNSLIHFYVASCRIECLKRVFDECPECRDIVTWNAMLAGCARDRKIEAAEELFKEMA